jgi:hypothetical protein
VSLIIANRYPGKDRSGRWTPIGWNGSLPLYRLVTSRTTRHNDLLIRYRMIFNGSKFFLNGTVKLLPQCLAPLPKSRVIGRWLHPSSRAINRRLGTRLMGIFGRHSLVWIKAVKSGVENDIIKAESVNGKGFDLRTRFLIILMYIKP